MPKRRTVIALVLFVSVACSIAGAGVFLRTNASWYDGSVYQMDAIGSPYLGGFGFSGELGVDLSQRTALSLEYAPSYRLPPRKVPYADGLGVGAYRLAAANVTLRMEPIGDIQPYFLFGAGQGVFTFDYGDTGRVFILGGAERRLQQETLSAWIVGLGFGIEVPITTRLYWGVRGRYLYHRWQASTDVGRFLPYESGGAFTVGGNLKYQF